MMHRARSKRTPVIALDGASHPRATALRRLGPRPASIWDGEAGGAAMWRGHATAIRVTRDPRTNRSKKQSSPAARRAGSLQAAGSTQSLARRMLTAWPMRSSSTWTRPASSSLSQDAQTIGERSGDEPHRLSRRQIVLIAQPAVRAGRSNERLHQPRRRRQRALVGGDETGYSDGAVDRAPAIAMLIERHK